MCFILCDFTVKKANEDIVCYKILKCCGGKIISFYYDFEYELGKVYSSGINKNVIPLLIHYDGFTGRHVIE